MHQFSYLFKLLVQTDHNAPVYSIPQTQYYAATAATVIVVRLHCGGTLALRWHASLGPQQGFLLTHAAQRSVPNIDAANPLTALQRGVPL